MRKARCSSKSPGMPGLFFDRTNRNVILITVEEHASCNACLLITF